MRIGKIKCFVTLFLLLFLTDNIPAQVREYFIHDRGMLHETVYNTGIIARPWANQGNTDGTVILPQFEWPGNKEVIAYVVEGIEYYGQHCSKGAGMWIIANPLGKPGINDRLFAFCGAVGQGNNPANEVGVWSFPIEFYKIENYPILEDGTLNPDYDPGEAEQIIVAKWATSTGVTVTRTSRQWSYPDYDDFIIYEYTLEYTGDTDGNPNTIEMEDVDALQDVFVTFEYSLAPSLYGYMRHYKQWKWNPGVHNGDNWASFDSDYWLIFNADAYTGKEDGKTRYLMAKPEPNPDLFMEFATTGKNGGGFCSPQAVGYCVLYYDTDHLARIDTLNPENSESNIIDVGNFSVNWLDEDGKVKQPWELDRDVGWNRESDLIEGKKGSPSLDRNRTFQNWYKNGDGKIFSEHPDPWWRDRDAPFSPTSVDKALARYVTFGPYKLNRGDKIDFTIAEVAGFGAEPGKVINGALQKKQWAPYPTLDKKVVLDGQVMTEHYLTDFGYPDYVNSNVKNVTQVAHKAFEAYLGTELEYSNEIAKNPMRPEENPKDGVYSMPVPPPAPVFVVKNTATGDVKITWTRAAEEFNHPNLTGSPSVYKVYRSISYIGPWKLLGTINVGDVNADGIYEFSDNDPEFKVGSTGYYAVTSVDADGNESGKSNIVKHIKNVGAVEKLGKVYVAPNPFYMKSGFSGTGEEDMIGFYGLPEKCTIKIYSFAGQLVKVIEHDDPTYNTTWMQVTRNQQEIASGVYFYVVTTPDGEKATGKFVIIK